MFQKVLVAIFILAITYAMMTPLVAQVGQSLNQSAEMIAAASNPH